MLKLLLGDPNARKLKRYQPIVSDINLLEEEVAPLSDDELRSKTTAFQQRLADAGRSSLCNVSSIEGSETLFSAFGFEFILRLISSDV